MGADLLIALQITAAGMGLVFGAIVLLWAVMAALVRLTSEKPASTSALTSSIEQQERKRKAAAAAVAIALALEPDSEPHEFPLPPTAIVSAWQSVMRSNMLTKRGRNR